jgi:hypothetical protein
MKIHELFEPSQILERAPEDNEYAWHQEVSDRVANSAQQKVWRVVDAKGREIFHQLDLATAKKAAMNPNFIKKFGKLKVEKMK